jgi:phosphoribosylaminoimidazolecarboxamide formyltransferase/IMP cyclohydrolase
MAPTALLSVSDKAGLVPLASGLLSHGYQLLSSGGTATALAAAGLPVTRVADYTGAPEILGGRVKTLHPRIHGGILARRDDAGHRADLEAQAITPIDVVVVNLYPFRQTVADPAVDWQTAIETIDIGGPAMVRAAAKNHGDVAVLTDPAQYPSFLEALAAGRLDGALRRRLALAAFQHTAAYDGAISSWLAQRLGDGNCAGAGAGDGAGADAGADAGAGADDSGADPVAPLRLALPVQQRLRYGENPHQSASWFSDPQAGWGAALQLQGKDLSYNNLIDLDAALATVREFGYGEGPTDRSAGSSPAAVVIKHTNPCGVALGTGVAEALQRALDADRTSAFGGIVALNRPVDAAAAALLTGLFLECVVAPQFLPGALDILASKANLRVLTLPAAAVAAAPRLQRRSVLGGLLEQEADDLASDPQQWKVVSARQPSAQELADLDFAWRVVRHGRSNAIVVAAGGCTLGIGVGQTNRVGAARGALETAGASAQGAVLSSDGFFPFDDSVRLAAAHGITAIIQPGGSLRDADSIAACDSLGLAMVMTGRRHFLH